MHILELEEVNIFEKYVFNLTRNHNNDKKKRNNNELKKKKTIMS